MGAGSRFRCPKSKPLWCVQVKAHLWLPWPPWPPPETQQLLHGVLSRHRPKECCQIYLRASGWPTSHLQAALPHSSGLPTQPRATHSWNPNFLNLPWPAGSTHRAATVCDNITSVYTSANGWKRRRLQSRTTVRRWKLEESGSTLAYTSSPYYACARPLIPIPALKKVKNEVTADLSTCACYLGRCGRETCAQYR